MKEFIFNAIQAQIQTSPAITMSENAIKVLIVDEMLKVGYILIEGGCAGCKKVWMADGHLDSVILNEPAGKKTSPDIRVIHPVKCVIELQSRSDIGSQDSLFSNNIVDDIQRVLRGDADLFVLVSDNGVFQKLMGHRDTRGRKPLYGDLVTKILKISDRRRIYTTFKTNRHVVFIDKNTLGESK